MRHSPALLTLAMLAAGLMPQAAAAQHPYRSGFWLEDGVGTGTIRIGCSSCAEPRAVYGQSSYLRLGGSLSERVLLGFEVFALLDEHFGLAEADSSLTVENVSVGPVVLWYPWQSGMFFKGGFGLAHGEVTVAQIDGPPTILASGTGSAVTFGAGFDVPILKWFSLTANFGIYFTALGDVNIQGTYMDDVITSMYNANFAVTLR